MMPSEPIDIPTRVFRAFDPRPLLASQADVYVDLSPARGEPDTNLIVEMEQAIRLSEPGRNFHQLISGHRGCGKSTELNRLRDRLWNAKPAQRYFTVMCRADDHLDRNDIDLPDLLLAILRQVVDDIRAAQAEKTHPLYNHDGPLFAESDSKLATLWDNLKALLPPFYVDSVTAKIGGATPAGPFSAFGELSATMRASPSTRVTLRQLLEPRVEQLSDVLNELLLNARLLLRDAGITGGLVVIVDDLDKMVLRETEPGCSSAEYLFRRRGERLAALDCHTIFTIPVEVVYAHYARALEAHFPRINVLPMVKIRERPSCDAMGNPRIGEPYAPGYAMMRKMATARLDKHALSEGDAFEPGVLDACIRVSGGQPTELMRFIQETALRASTRADAENADAKLDMRSLETAANKARNAILDAFRDAYWKVIQEVRLSGRAPQDDAQELAVRQLLDARVVLRYENGDYWQDINPLLDDVQPPAHLKP